MLAECWQSLKRVVWGLHLIRLQNRWANNDELHMVHSPNSTSWSSVMMSMMLGLMFRRSPWTRPRRPWPRVVKPKQTSGAARTIIQARFTSCIMGLQTGESEHKSEGWNPHKVICLEKNKDVNASGFPQRSKQMLLWLTEIGERLNRTTFPSFAKQMTIPDHCLWFVINH